jgi:hypothetical protein
MRISPPKPRRWADGAAHAQPHVSRRHEADFGSDGRDSIAVEEQLVISEKLNFAVKEDRGADVLAEGLCGHCQAFCVFKQMKASNVVRVLSDDWEEDEPRTATEEFLFGICPRPSCGQATVVRRTRINVTYRGDPQEGPPDSLEVIFPRVRSARSLPSDEVPVELRKRYEEAASIEFLSPTSAGFMAARMVDQAIRHRLFVMKRSQRSVRKSTLADLIGTYVEIEKGNPELREMLTVVKDFRNLAAHPPFVDLSAESEIDQREASFLLDCCLELLEFAYARPARVRAMTERLKSRLPTRATPSSIKLAPAPAEDAANPIAGDDEVPF